MKISIVYDNTVFKKNLKSDWGFSCFVELEENPNILFDTGKNPNILMDNLKKLNIKAADIDEIFISHSHHDHTGGLAKLLQLNNELKIYIPKSFNFSSENEVIRVTNPIKLHENIYTTGEINNIEQSLIIKTEKGLVIISGCAHSKVENIITVAKKFGVPKYLIGGLHGFRKYKLLKNFDLICPTHCTKHIKEIKHKYPGKYLQGGVGRVIKI